MNLNNYQRQKIISLIKKLNIIAKDINLYFEAMTHNSYNNEHKLGFTYQRLEFLGDAIISKIISCYLFYLKYDEQKMTEIRKMIVSGKTLKRASEDLGLIQHAFLGKGINSLTDTCKIKEDLFESLIGAIYIDQGELKVFEILKQTIIKYYKDDDLHDNIDYKTKIQEIFQKNHTPTNKKNKIYYESKKRSDNSFETTLLFNNIKYGRGIGKTIKEAEMNAAKEAYLIYEKSNNFGNDNLKK